MGNFVQQTTITGLVNGFNSPQTITGTTQGNTLLVPFYHANNSNNGTSITCDDGTNSYTLDIRQDRASTYTVGVFRLSGIAGGNTTVTLKTTSGTAPNSFWTSTILEYTGLSGVIDTVGSNKATNGSTTGPVTVTSNALANASNLLLAIAIGESNTGGLTNDASFTGRGLATHLSVNERITSSTSPVTASCGTLNVIGWDAVIIPYVLNIVVPYPPMSKGGIGVQMCQ